MMAPTLVVNVSNLSHQHQGIILRIVSKVCVCCWPCITCFFTVNGCFTCYFSTLGSIISGQA